jgi:ferredoxin
MPFAVTQACINCKHTDCVAVCPMNCFVEGPNFLAINPDECIDCSICVPECPVEAIINAAEATPEQQADVDLNAQLARDPRWRRISRAHAALPDHAHWASVESKRHLLQQPG